MPLPLVVVKSLHQICIALTPHLYAFLQVVDDLLAFGQLCHLHLVTLSGNGEPTHHFSEIVLRLRKLHQQGIIVISELTLIACQLLISFVKSCNDLEDLLQLEIAVLAHSVQEPSVCLIILQKLAFEFSQADHQ